ncbi:MAG: thermonuclease family protein [Candidatus Omnitrophica bacterium]|nr:thermonuclease family protein [Candidatus Omnitrophota bacterium]MBU1996606.1 thermonuclease family protein [Candidatus Omnitrophota bacterium]
MLVAKTQYNKLFNDISNIYEKAKKKSVEAVNEIVIAANWEIGKRIVEDEQKGELRAAYGEHLIEDLSRDLNEKHGSGFSPTNLRFMRKYFLLNPIQYPGTELSWSHQKLLLSVDDEKKRKSLEKKVIKENLSKEELRTIIGVEKEVISKKQAKAKVESKDKAPAPVLATVRGKGFHYKVKEIDLKHKDQKIYGIDCGFGNFKEVAVGGIKRSDGQVVKAIKVPGGYNFELTDVPYDEIYTFKAYVEKVIDADTLWVNIDCGFGFWSHQKLRLRGIDAPEIDTKEGQKAKRFVESCLKPGYFIVVKTYKSDKFDRYLTDIFYSDIGDNKFEYIAKDGKFLNQELLDKGMAELYLV